MVIMVALVVGTVAGAQTSGRAPARVAGKSSAVATVGSLRIEAAALEERMNEARQAYRAQNGSDVDDKLEPLLRRQVLENLIRQRLLILDGRRGLGVTDAEADAQLRRDPTFQSDGVFNEAKYLAIKSTNPTMFAQAIRAIKEQLATQKQREQVDRETRPDDAAIRAEVERQLSRASVEFLALRVNNFDGTYPEPREAEIIAYHTGHAERFRRPEQAMLSLIIVNRPAMNDAVDATAAGFRTWDDRTRARADSAIAAIRAGAKFADLAPLHGGMKAGIVLRRDKLPEFWNGGPRDVAAVFAAAPGTILAQPIRSGTGWAVVRVDQLLPARIAPLLEVAREIRRDLRAAARARHDDVALRAIYQTVRDSLGGDGYRLRYALADTASFTPAEPSAQELDRYYRAHLADYMSYNRSSGAVVEQPFSAVRDEIRRRWFEERRRDLTRAAAERVHEAWRRGRRDAATERTMTRVREIGPVPASLPVDSSQVGALVTSALAAREGKTGVGMIPTDGGLLVYDLHEVIAGYIPTFEQARPLLAERLAVRRAVEDEAAARAAVEADPATYRMPGTLQFTRVVVEMREAIDMDLTRDEVERYYRIHQGDFSIKELVRVRHILISATGPGPEADAAARRKAEDVLQRVRAGEDFGRLAAEFSDDPATRENGGDVGVFRRGQMNEAFERAAFAMRLGDIAGPVHSEVGYHVMECLEYQPPIIHPLVEVYSNVAHDVARKKAERVSMERADSLYRTLKSVAHAKEVASRLNLLVLPSEHTFGRLGLYGDDLQPYIAKLETLKPGTLYPGTQFYSGLGTAITWVDSILPPRLPTWQEARDQALQRYRRGSGERALLAKKAELDSLSAAGWSFDSLTALWGGAEISSEVTPGTELRGLGGRWLADSLVFGRGSTPGLPAGMVSDWVAFPNGHAKLRVTGRLDPDPAELARRIEIRRQIVLWRNLNQYFDRLKARYPVEILDAELRATALAEPNEP